MAFDCFLCGEYWTFLSLLYWNISGIMSTLVLYLPATLWFNKELHGFAASLLWDCIMSSFPPNSPSPLWQETITCNISLWALCSSWVPFMKPLWLIIESKGYQKMHLCPSWPPIINTLIVAIFRHWTVIGHLSELLKETCVYNCVLVKDICDLHFKT